MGNRGPAQDTKFRLREGPPSKMGGNNVRLVEAAPSKFGGLGLISRRNFEAGDVVLVETPFLTVHPCCFMGHFFTSIACKL